MEERAIGETTGLVWNFLRLNGESNLSALAKGVEAPKLMVSMAVGWLAREGKLELKHVKRAIRVSLRDV